MANKSNITANQVETLKVYTRLMRAVNDVSRRMHRHLSKHNLTVSQFGVLEALYHLGPLSQREIGRKILKTSGNITMVIDNLEKRALVIRGKHPGDRRRFQVHLSPAGEKLIRSIFPRHAENAETVFSALTPDERKLLGVLSKKLGGAA